MHASITRLVKAYSLLAALTFNLATPRKFGRPFGHHWGRLHAPAKPEALRKCTKWSMPNASPPSDLKAAETPAVPQISPKEKVVCIVLLYQTRQTGHQFFDGHCCRTKLSCPKTCKPLQSLRILCDRLPSAIAWMPIQFAWARFHAMRPVRAFANWSPEDPRPFSQFFVSKLSLPLVKLPACGR